jgi:hypothetical protein
VPKKNVLLTQENLKVIRRLIIEEANRIDPLKLRDMEDKKDWSPRLRKLYRAAVPITNALYPDESAR